MEIKGTGVLAALLGGSLLSITPGCGPGTSAPLDGPAPEEVQVGYGTQSEDDVVGSISSLSGEELEQQRAATMERLLMGRIPGLQVIRVHGEPSLRIRGGGDPHVVIDGMPSSTRDLLMLAPEVVDRIDVRKDGGAAIYGLRGANGVILVTTKRAP